MSMTKQTIAIIGAGKSTGSRMAGLFSERNYRILLFDDNIPEIQAVRKSIRQKSQAADIEVLECKHEACWEADVIMLSVHYKSLDEIAEKIYDVATQKTVIYVGKEDEFQYSEIRNELTKLLPHSKIVIVNLNTVPGEEMNDNPYFRIIDSGINPQVEKEVKLLFEDAGFKLTEWDEESH